MNALNSFFRKYGAALILLVAGICLTVAMSSQRRKLGYYERTDAVITRIDEAYDAASENWTYTAYVKYTVDGTDYEQKLSDFNASFKEGKTVAVAYDPEDPEKVIYADAGYTRLLTIIGIAAIVIGAVLLVLSVLKIAPWAR